MKVIVTGSNGQLGSELMEQSGEVAHSFVFTDFDELDITNKNTLLMFFRAQNPDIVINCAAYTAVDKAEGENEKAYELNSVAVENLVEACKISDSILIHISTDYVFDGEKYTPYTESDATNPMSVYGKTKLEGEKNALKYEKSIVIRTSWLYSQFGNNFVKTMLKLGNEKKSINVVSDQIGSPTYARDLAIAIVQIINAIGQCPEKTSFGIFQFSNSGYCSWYDFATKIMQISKLKCKVNPICTEQYPTVARRPKCSVLSSEKIKNTYCVNTPNWILSLEDCLKKILK